MTERRIYTYQPMLHCANSTAKGIIGGLIVVALVAAIVVCAVG